MPQNRGSLEALIAVPVVLTNPFPHNHHMASRTSNTRNASSGIQNPSTHEGGHLCVNMVKSHIDVATRSRDYGSSQTIIGPESPPPLGNTLVDRKSRTSASYSKRSTKELCP
jgi:hypothetical protein